MGVLQLIKPLVGLIPEVAAPDRKLPYRERALWTVVSLCIFLVMSQIPLYGVNISALGDPFAFVRLMMASNRGSLLELGIAPIVTASMVTQLAAGARIIEYDPSVKEDQMLYQAAQKLIGLLICSGEAVAYVFSGMYGPIDQLGYANATLLVLQLVVAGTICLLLDDLLRQYGLGGGLTLFIATNICESIFWRAFSPTTFNTGRGTEFEGAVIALFHLVLTRESTTRALHEAFYRTNLPNMLNLVATLFVFCVVVFFQGFKVEVPLRSVRQRGMTASYPIKLFYTSNIPIILQSALVSNLYFLSQLLFKRFPNSVLVRLLGTWAEIDGGGGQMKPVFGVAYYISPARSFQEVWDDPLHFVIYVAFICTACAVFARTWIEVSQQGPRDVARNLRDQGFQISGYRQDSMISYFNKYIPTAAALGGVCIGALSILSDLSGAIGSGTGILLAVTFIYSLFEEYAKESAKEGGLLAPGMM